MMTNTELPKIEQAPESTAQQPGPRLPLTIRLLLVVVGMFAAALAPAVVQFSPGLASAVQSAPLEVQAIIVMASWLLALPVYIAVAWGLTRGVDRRPLAEAGWMCNRRSPLALLFGTLVGAGVVVVATLILLPTGRIQPAEPIGIGWGLSVAFMLVRSFVLQGIGEELLWRGYVLQTMRRRPIAALFVSTLVFGALHLVSGGGQQSLADHLWYLAMPIGFAFLAGVLALRSRSLWTAIGVHGGFHVGTFIVAGLGWGIEGALGWVSIGVLYVLVGLVVLARTPKRLLAAGSDRSPFEK